MFSRAILSFREELRKVYNLIYGVNTTAEKKRQAHVILQTWKARRSQETLNGVLCTLALLDVHVKDITGKVTDSFTLSTLYASTLTKFINYSASFQMHQSTMYRSAQKLGIDSFLIDLRHLCAHGRVMPSLEVFRKTNSYCLEWIRKFFWEKELENVSDASSKEIRYDVTLVATLKNILPFYDTLAELLRKNIVDFDDVSAKTLTKQRWPTMGKFMAENKFKDFRQAFKFLTAQLTKVIESRTMNQNPRTFFHEMFELCEFFMQAVEVKETGSLESSDEAEITPQPKKKRKRESQSSIVVTYQSLIWQVAKHDHLKLLLEMLYQLSETESENKTRRASARFWICTILRSFEYYQRYCSFDKNNALLPTKVTPEIRKFYQYQLDAELKQIIIFAGTQLLPTSLKYSREFFDQLLNNVTADSAEVCKNILHFVHPPLSAEQLKRFHDLIAIATNNVRKSQKATIDKVYTVEDLLAMSKPQSSNENSNLIWELSNDDIDWSLQPIGKNFSIQA